MTETTLTTKLIRYIKSKPNSWAVKFYPGRYGEAGVPDILACINGKFCGFEVKLPSKAKNTTKLQDVQIERIKKANGIAGVITCKEDIDFLLKEMN